MRVTAPRAVERALHPLFFRERRTERARVVPPTDHLRKDLEFIASVGPSLGSALRRTMYANDGVFAVPSPPAVIVLDSNLSLVSWTAGARTWIDALPPARLFAQFGMLAKRRLSSGDASVSTIRG